MRKVFLAASLAHVVAAGVHLVALVRSHAPADSPARHALFVAINLGAAIGFLRRPRYFVPLFAVLVAQQLVSHGSDAIHAWKNERRVDVVSLLVVAWMPTALFLLWREGRLRGATIEAGRWIDRTTDVTARS